MRYLVCFLLLCSIGYAQQMKSVPGLKSLTVYSEELTTGTYTVALINDKGTTVATSKPVVAAPPALVVNFSGLGLQQAIYSIRLKRGDEPFIAAGSGATMDAFELLGTEYKDQSTTTSLSAALTAEFIAQGYTTNDATKALRYIRRGILRYKNTELATKREAETKRHTTIIQSLEAQTYYPGAN